MGEHIVPLHEIQPQLKKGTIKIEVMEKGYPRASRNSSQLYQRLILGDWNTNTGNHLRFRYQTLEHSLIEYQKYYISNVNVRPIQPDYRVVENNFQLYINGATLVEEITGSEDNLTVPVFTPFTQLHSHIGPEMFVDIMAAAVKIFPTRQITLPNGREATIQETMLLTEEMMPILLTLFDQYINNEGRTIADAIDTWPIIVGKRLKVHDFHGPALSTMSKSCLMINPDILEKDILHYWCNYHKQEIEALILTKTHEPTCTSRSAPTPSDIITAEEAKKMKGMDTFWLNATALLSNFSQKFWYASCDKCNKAIHTECGKVYTCVYCKQLATAKPRSRFEVQLLDKSGHITAKCLGQLAERLFPFTAAELKAHSNEDGLTERCFLEENLSTGKHLILLGPKGSSQSYQSERKTREAPN